MAWCLAPVCAEQKAPEQKAPMTRATGTFEVKLAPVGNDSTPEGPNLARMSMDKTFAGDFDGVGKGEMITAAGIAVKESAAYSAVERLTGTLNGKKGVLEPDTGLFVSAGFADDERGVERLCAGVERRIRLAAWLG